MEQRYICWKCPKCGRIQGSISRQFDVYKISLKCKNEKCMSTTQLKNKKTGNFKAEVWFCRTEREVAEKVSELTKL